MKQHRVKHEQAFPVAILKIQPVVQLFFIAVIVRCELPTTTDLCPNDK